MKCFRIFFIFIFCLPASIQAQDFSWEGGLSVGASNYMGDLVEPAVFNLRETQLGFGLFLRRNLHPNWSTRINAFYGKLSGDDRHYFNSEYRTSRAYQFSTVVNELSLLVEWEPFAYKSISKDKKIRRPFSPYLFAGFGTAVFDPNPNFEFTQIPDAKSLTRQDILNSFRQTHQTLPFGIGMKFQQDRQLTIGLEFSARTAFTDYLDGVSQSANPNDNDWFFSGAITAAFKWMPVDTDGDGVADIDDQCPKVAGVDFLRGCPDADGDNVPDHVDKCPDNPGGKSAHGCPDSDQDGIYDWKDKCPDIAGPKEREGCPNPDLDGDGIVNHLDNCPTLAGPSYKQGCPLIDSDRDGIIDEVDRCPQVKGPLKAEGCPDQDGDGIADAEDKCPTEAGIASEGGCPIAQLPGPVVVASRKLPDTETQADPFKEILQNAFFDTNSALLSPDHYIMLDKLADLVRRQPYFKVRIKGHADSSGSPNYNKYLSEQRAKACVNYLISQGVPENRINFTGYGESRPDADNDSEENKKLNRRVEFNLYKAKEIEN